MPRLVQWSRFSDAFQKLFGLQGNTQLNVVDDVFLTLPVEDELLHLSHLRGWKPFALTSNQAAVAAQFANVALQARPGSLVVIEGFQVVGTVANQEVQIGVPGGAAALAVGAFLIQPARDLRQLETNTAGVAGLRAPVGVQPGSNGLQQLGLPIGCLRVVSSPPGFPSAFMHVPYVLANTGNPNAPQGVLMFENNVVNLGLTVSVFGKYRELTTQEQ